MSNMSTIIVPVTFSPYRSLTLKDGRYTIAHKLGYGGYSTVWLVKDSLTEKYASLKVLAADAAGWSGNSSSSSASGDHEIIFRLHLDGDEDEGKEHVVRLLDHFEHHGDNGTHRCIVTELLGPSLSSDIEDVYPTEIFPSNVAKRFIREICYGVRYLHSKGIVHGDLHPGNPLLRSPAFASWSTQEEVDSFLGKPEKKPLCIKSASDSNTTSSPTSKTCAPGYVVIIPDPTPLLHLCLDDPAQAHIKICDFSESFIFDSAAPVEGRKVHLPYAFRAPEVFFDNMQASPAPSTDIWALAVLFHFLFTGGMVLFPSPLGVRDGHLIEMVLTLKKKFPEPAWSSWANRARFFDNNGNWVGDQSRPPWSGKLLRLLEQRMDDTERDKFGEMLKSMVDYDPAKRATIGEVIASDWFVRYCRDVA